VLAEQPARIFRLPQKGGIAPGKDADLVIFDPAASATLSDDGLHGRAYYSLYAGRTVHGLPRTVLQRGKTVLDRGTLAAKPGPGRFVPAGQPSQVTQPA
jgi:dihydropyrimidinase